MVSVVRHSWGCGGEYSVVCLYSVTASIVIDTQACTSLRSYWTSQSTCIVQRSRGGEGQEQDAKYRDGMELRVC